MHGERFDAMVSIAGCDKSLPGMLMAAARHNMPSVFLYGGSSLPGRYGGKDISIVVPLYNEEESVGPMLDAIRQAVEPMGLDHEF